MIEPEMAFCDLNSNMDLAEKFIKSVLKKILLKCGKDLKFLDDRHIKEQKNKPKRTQSEALCGSPKKLVFIAFC